MWSYLAREANWTEIITNTLALGFSPMSILVITYTVLFRPEMLAAVGSVTSGITGVILGYYFNRGRLKAAQSRAKEAENRREDTGGDAKVSENQAATLDREYRSLLTLVLRYMEERNPERGGSRDAN